MDPIEQEIQAKGLTAPRITPADIEAAIASEHCFTAHDGITGARYNAEPRSSMQVLTSPPPAFLLTFCVLVMRNGFTVVGKSACASPENFDAELGRKIARQDAINQCWPLLGYELRSKLAARPADFRDRVRLELAELNEKLEALKNFIASTRFDGLPEAEQIRMIEQRNAMDSYAAVLQQRIEAFTDGAPA